MVTLSTQVYKGCEIKFVKIKYRIKYIFSQDKI